jgi:dihydropteroate synthase
MRFWKCGRFDLLLGRRTYVMGILNVTPDSFSGDGTGADLDSALRRARQMIEDGADILDIGGESTRPGAAPVAAEEEVRRVVPLVQQLVARLNVPISVDTTKAVVAREALKAGASIINDISGATFDADMLRVLGDSDCGCVLMHLRGTPQTMGWSARAGAENSPGVIEEIVAFWSERVTAAHASGVARERIALDAGFGFGKSLDENLEVLRRGRELSNFGFPTLSGTSRKSSIGKVLNDAPVSERQWGTAATVALAIANGCDIVRVHDVREMAQVARMSDAVVRGNTCE